MYQLGTHLNKFASSNEVQSQYSLWRENISKSFWFLSVFFFLMNVMLTISYHSPQNLAGPSHKSAYIIHSTVLVSCQRRCQVLNKNAVSGGCEWRLTPTLRVKNSLPFQPALTFHSIHVRVRVVPGGRRGFMPHSCHLRNRHPDPLVHWITARIALTLHLIWLNSHIISLWPQ